VSYEAGDLIVVPFPFTDLSSDKQRPALVLTPHEYNRDRPDALLAHVTSVPQEDAHSVHLTDAQIAAGELVKESWVRTDKLFTLEQTRIRKRAAAVSEDTLDEVRSLLADPIIDP